VVPARFGEVARAPPWCFRMPAERPWAIAKLATALAAAGDTYIVQYPQRAERSGEPAAETVQDHGPAVCSSPVHGARLRRCGCSVTAWRCRRLRVRQDRRISRCCSGRLWASAAPAPSAVAAKPDLPTSHDDLIVDIVDFGGTMPSCLPTQSSPSCWSPRYGPIMRRSIAIPEPRNSNLCRHFRIGSRGELRVDATELELWQEHTAGSFDLSWYDGGHFFLDDHIDDRRRAGECRWLRTGLRPAGTRL